MVKIIPAVLTDNLLEAKRLIAQVDGLVERVQIDVIDGVFAENETFDPSLMKEVDTSMYLDFHLMVKEPEDWIEKCVRADRIFGHVEMMSSQEKFVKNVHAKGISAGLAIDLETSVEKIDERILTAIDSVLVMSVRAGFGGQDFDTRVLEKINWLKTKKDEMRSGFTICDDGGVSLGNIDNIHFVGVDEVVIGRRLYEGDIAANLKKYQEQAHNL